MLVQWRSLLHRAALVLLLISVLALGLPQAGQAAPAPSILVKFEILSVKANESITIHTVDFPVRTKFVVRIGEAKQQAAKAAVVAEFNSEKGGAIEATYAIPAELKDKRILGIRIESPDGYYAYDWFFNNTYVYVTDKNQTPELSFSGVKKDKSVTVEGKNLPANTLLGVRVGPYDNFYRSYATLDSVRSDENGKVKFELSLPKAAQGVENVTVRLDGGGRYAINTFKNADGGQAVPANQLVKYEPCKAILFKGLPDLEPREDFDVVWMVQNTSNHDWKEYTVDYAYASGTKMHKREDVHDLSPVKNGDSAFITIDMLAPEQSGYYTTTWKITEADQTLCTFSITVFVK